MATFCYDFVIIFTLLLDRCEQPKIEVANIQRGIGTQQADDDDNDDDVN